MIIECHSPQSKCIPVSICHPIVNCCKCPSECVCLTNCCSQDPNINFQTDICENQNELTYEIMSKCPLSPIINCQKIKSQYRNSTPDITRIHSKTNSYFNIDRNNLEDNYINNKNKTPLNNYIREKTENYNHDTDRNNLITKPNNDHSTLKKSYIF